MNVKKLSMILCLALVVSVFAGCGSQAEAPQPVPTETTLSAKVESPTEESYPETTEFFLETQPIYTPGRNLIEIYNDPSREGAPFLDEIRPFYSYAVYGEPTHTALEILASEKAYQGITVKSPNVDDTPVYEVFVDDGTVKPLAILLAGGDQHRDACFRDACELALRGIYVICMDSAGCGESTKGPLDALASFAETVYQIDSVIEYYNTMEGVDATRFGIRGTSKGANIAFAYVGHGLYRPTVISANSGTPDYTGLGDGPLYDCFAAGSGGQTRFMTDEETLEFAQRYSPIQWPERFVDVYVYAYNGTEDELTSVEGCRALEEALKAMGADKFTFQYFEGYGHGGFPVDDLGSFAECLLSNQ